MVAISNVLDLDLVYPIKNGTNKKDLTNKLTAKRKGIKSKKPDYLTILKECHKNHNNE